MNRRGFTLTELVVVVAIVGIVLSMLLPCVQSAYAAGRNVDCMGNLRSLSGSAAAFELDRDRFPHPKQWVWDEWRLEGLLSWSYRSAVVDGEMFPYMEDTEAYVCSEFERVYPLYPPFTNVERAYASYSQNEYFTGCYMECYDSHHGPIFSINRSTGVCVTRPLVRRPAHLALFAEENPYVTDDNTHVIDDLALGVGSYKDPTPHSAFASFHQGRSNAVFCDGHVERVSPMDSKERCTPERVKGIYR